jgi:peptidoglycan/xylan/chitin deacetylase (PgdA/CDA1 family)
VNAPSLWRPAALGAALVAIAGAGPSLVAVPGLRRRLTPRLAGLGGPGHIALTFDDGPDPKTTPRFLTALDRLGWKATFFMLGGMVDRAPGLAGEVAAAGHEVALHGYGHRSHLARLPTAVIDDVSRGAAVVEAATGRRPGWHRPPYGHVATATLVGAHRLGVPVVLWSTWGREWTPGATAKKVADRVERDLTPGATVLLHDSDCTSPAGSAAAALGALDYLAERWARAGLRPGPLADHWLAVAGSDHGPSDRGPSDNGHADNGGTRGKTTAEERR